MAKVLLHPIGGPVEDIVDMKAFRENSERMGKLNALLVERREEVRRGWGDTYVERVHAKGKLTTWERIEILRDADSTIFPVNGSMTRAVLMSDSATPVILFAHSSSTPSNRSRPGLRVAGGLRIFSGTAGSSSAWSGWTASRAAARAPAASGNWPSR